MAIGAHVRYQDGSVWLPEMDCWLTFLTHQEYGFIYETQITETLLSGLRIFMRDERLGLYPSWSHWNEERGCDSRFIYPRWVDGFSVYFWPDEIRGRRSVFSRLIGTYGYPSSEGVLGPTIHWLLSTNPTEQQRRWHEQSACPPTPTALGPQRSRHYRVPKHGIVPIALCSVALGLGAANWPDAFQSWVGIFTMLPLAVFALAPWWSELFSETRLHDHGLRFRRWFILRETVFYDQVGEIGESAAGTHVVTSGGRKIQIPKSHGVPALTLRDFERRSLAMRCAPGIGVPFAETGGH